jgi:hypothetical protein
MEANTRQDANLQQQTEQAPRMQLNLVLAPLEQQKLEIQIGPHIITGFEFS